MAELLEIMVRQSESDSMLGESAVATELENANIKLVVADEDSVQISRQDRPQMFRGRPRLSLSIGQTALNSLGVAFDLLRQDNPSLNFPVRFNATTSGGNYTRVQMVIVGATQTTTITWVV